MRYSAFVRSHQFDLFIYLFLLECYFYERISLFFIHSHLAFHQICWNMFHKNDTFMTSQTISSIHYVFSALSLQSVGKVQRVRENYADYVHFYVSLTLAFLYQWFDKFYTLFFSALFPQHTKIFLHNWLIRL